MKNTCIILIFLGLCLFNSCDLYQSAGCTNSSACNYDQDSLQDDGTCILPMGCNNWCEGDLSEIRELDSCDSCRVEDSEDWNLSCTGCMESCAQNFDASASITGNCEYVGVSGTIQSQLWYNGAWPSIGFIYLEYLSQKDTVELKISSILTEENCILFDNDRLCNLTANLPIDSYDFSIVYKTQQSTDTLLISSNKIDVNCNLLNQQKIYEISLPSIHTTIISLVINIEDFPGALSVLSTNNDLQNILVDLYPYLGQATFNTLKFNPGTDNIQVEYLISLESSEITADQFNNDITELTNGINLAKKIVEEACLNSSIEYCDICGGNNAIQCITMVTTDCNNVVDGIAYYDPCYTCVGGDTGEIPCETDCFGEWGGSAIEDACGVCGGSGTYVDECGDCDGDGSNCNIPGCTDLEACNYDPVADKNEGCEYSGLGCKAGNCPTNLNDADTNYDCDGDCITDSDSDGICDVYEIAGCKIPTASNFCSDCTDRDDSKCLNSATLNSELADCLQETEFVDPGEEGWLPLLIFGNCGDLENINNTYKNILEQNSDDPAANFGHGITELLQIYSDGDLKEAIEIWSNAMIDIFEDAALTSLWGLGRQDEFSSVGFMPNPDVLARISPILNKLPIGLALSGQSLDRDTAAELVRIQEMLEDYILPRINQAIISYERIIGSGYTFEITGEMQGDGNHESIYMDDGVFYLTNMLLHFIRANIYAIVAYDINIPYGNMDFLDELASLMGEEIDELDLSDSEDLYNIYMYLSQDSDFLTLRNQEAMPGILNDFASIHELATGFVDLTTDGEYDNDLFTFMQDLDDSDIEEIERYLDYFDDAIEDEIILEFCTVDHYDHTHQEIYVQDSDITNCDDDPYLLTVNLSNFCNSPPENLKDILFGYEVEVKNYELPGESSHYDYYAFETQSENSVSPNPRTVTYTGTSYIDIMYGGLGSYNWDYSSCNKSCGGYNILVNDYELPFNFYNNWSSFNNNCDYNYIADCDEFYEAADVTAQIFKLTLDHPDAENMYQVRIDYDWQWVGDVSESSNCHKSGNPSADCSGGNESSGSGDADCVCTFDIEYMRTADIHYYIAESWWTIPYPKITIPTCNTNDFSSWKNSWDVTVGGLFPSMTTDDFFNNVLEMDEDNFSEFCEIFNP